MVYLLGTNNPGVSNLDCVNDRQVRWHSDDCAFSGKYGNPSKHSNRVKKPKSH